LPPPLKVKDFYHGWVAQGKVEKESTRRFVLYDGGGGALSGARFLGGTKMVSS
jgi:hypothetical protein